MVMTHFAEFGAAICKAWGLDPGKVGHIEIHLTPDEMPYAIVDVYLNGRIVQELLTLKVGTRQSVEES